VAQKVRAHGSQNKAMNIRHGEFSCEGRFRNKSILQTPVHFRTVGASCFEVPFSPFHLIRDEIRVVSCVGVDLRENEGLGRSRDLVVTDFLDNPNTSLPHQHMLIT
jgi:hypothetical protein